MFELIRRAFAALSKEDLSKVLSDPVFGSATLDQSGELVGALYVLYSNSGVVARTPMLRDPLFLSRLDAAFGKEWNEMGRGTLWQFAGVTPPTNAVVVNGKVRPSITL